MKKTNELKEELNKLMNISDQLLNSVIDREELIEQLQKDLDNYNRLMSEAYFKTIPIYNKGIVKGKVGILEDLIKSVKKRDWSILHKD